MSAGRGGFGYGSDHQIAGVWRAACAAAACGGCCAGAAAAASASVLGAAGAVGDGAEAVDGRIAAAGESVEVAGVHMVVQPSVGPGEHKAANNRLLADTGYNRAERAGEAAQEQEGGNVEVAAAAAAAAGASDYFEFHSRSSHKERFVRPEDEVAGARSIAD